MRPVFATCNRLLARIYKQLVPLPSPNLKGDRDIENTWIAANMPEGPGDALDFGTGGNWNGLLAARKGFNVICIDLLPISWPYRHAGLNFIRKDIFELDCPEEFFDLIINCSTIEHVGLADRYGITKEQEDDDLEAMVILGKLLKPGKPMIMTIPVGLDHVIRPYHRVYGNNRLPLLLSDWKIKKEEYWVKNKKNDWVVVDKEIALNRMATSYLYGLGLYVLTRSD